MPYVPLATGDRADLLARASRRWDEILAVRPDLAPALDLQRALITTVVDLMSTVDHSPLPRRFSTYVADKLNRGLPALQGEVVPLPVAGLRDALMTLCRQLAAGGAGDAADHIRSAIESGNINPESLLSASLARNQVAIREGAVHRGLAPDLLWLIAELAVSPFAHLLQREIFNADDMAGAAVDEWNRGYCPACGSWPAVAEVVAGRRVLRCSFCAAAWELNEYACIYCGESGEAFVTAAPVEERKDRRVEVCGACGGYLKTVDVEELSPFPLVAIADLETMDLDVAAMERGYVRLPLRTQRMVGEDTKDTKSAKVI